jgi:hypothetical protein
VICRKDTTGVLKATIEPVLTAGFKTLTQNNLTIGLNVKGEIECTFGNGSCLLSSQTPQKEMYIVGDLAFYAMIFGREHWSGHHCYLCRLSANYFTKLVKEGAPWTFELLNSLVETVRNGKPVEGCKVKAWWQFIKLRNYLVPLLHELICIGNVIFNHFKYLISEKIERLDPKEIAI